MARVNYCIPDGQKILRDELRSRYKGMMNIADVEDAIGAKSWDTATKFVEGLTAFNINGRRKWKTADIADRIWEVRIDHN